MKLGRHHLQSLLAVRPLERIYAGAPVGASGDRVLVRQLLPGLPDTEAAETGDVFERHMARLSTLSHPGTLPVREYGRGATGPFYFVTDVPKGTTLAELLRSAGSLPAATVCAVGVALAERLTHAHGAGVCHLGLHRGNVLVCANGDLTVIDLGLVSLLLERVDDRLRGVHAAWDSLFPDPGAIAPELLATEATGPATDVYGLGALLYLLATAVLPYSGSSVLAYNAILAASRPPDPRREIPDLDASLSELISSCLERRPADRPGLDQVQERLRACVEDDVHRLDRALAPYAPVLHMRSYLDRFEPLLRVVDGGRGRPDDPPPPSPAVVPLFGGDSAPTSQAELLASMSPEQRRIYLSGGRAQGVELGTGTRRDQVRRGMVFGVILAAVGLLAFLPTWLDRLDGTGDQAVLAAPEAASPPPTSPAGPTIEGAARSSGVYRTSPLDLRPVPLTFRRPPEVEVRPRQRGSIVRAEDLRVVTEPRPALPP